MTPEQFSRRLTELKKEFKDLFNKHAPAIAGNTAVKYFKQNFEKEAWGRVKWQEVKRRRNPNTRGAKATRRILAGDTGDLRRSIEIKSVENGKVVIWTDPSAFGSKEPYGRVHNEGLRAGRGRGFIMPKRQFMGQSEELNDLIIDAIEKRLSQLIK